MIVIVQDTPERISFCGLTYQQFMQLAAAVRMAIDHDKSLFRDAAKRLCMCRWSMDFTRRLFSLLHLTWEDIFVLNTILSEFKMGANEAEEQFLPDELIEAVEAAIQSGMGTRHLSLRRF